MATQLWLFLTIWREYKASISPISILITWNLEIMLDSCKITTKLLWKCFKMLKWGEMRHMNDQYCLKVLLYGCIKLFVPQYDFFMTEIILYWFFYLFLRQQKLQLQCVHCRFFDYVNPKLPVPDTGVSGFKVDRHHHQHRPGLSAHSFFYFFSSLYSDEYASIRDWEGVCCIELSVYWRFLGQNLAFCLSG